MLSKSRGVHPRVGSIPSSGTMFSITYRESQEAATTAKLAIVPVIVPVRLWIRAAV